MNKDMAILAAAILELAKEAAHMDRSDDTTYEDITPGVRLWDYETDLERIAKGDDQ